MSELQQTSEPVSGVSSATPVLVPPPVRPNLASRLLLHWLAWRKHRRAQAAKNHRPAASAGTVARDSAAHQDVQAHFLQALRRGMDTPSFPTALSSLPLRRVVALSVPGAEGDLPARLFIPRGRVRGAVLYCMAAGLCIVASTRITACAVVSHAHRGRPFCWWITGWLPSTVFLRR